MTKQEKKKLEIAELHMAYYRRKDKCVKRYKEACDREWKPFKEDDLPSDILKAQPNGKPIYEFQLYDGFADYYSYKKWEKSKDAYIAGYNKAKENILKKSAEELKDDYDNGVMI